MEIIPIRTERIELNPDQSLNEWVLQSIKKNAQTLRGGDILVMSSKVVSYFEDRVVSLSTLTASSEAKKIAKKMKADEQLIQVAIDESDEILAETPWVLLTRKNGILCANAGADCSNAPEGYVVLWPEDPFATARSIRQKLSQAFSIKKLAVILNDSVCIPGRNGTMAIALSYSGLAGYQDLKGEPDLFGNMLRYSALNIVDSLATASNLLMGESDSCMPIAIVRGYQWQQREETKKDEMIISPSDEMFPIP